MSVLPMRSSVKLLRSKPSPTARFANVESIVAATHNPQTLRRLSTDERFERRIDSDKMQLGGRTAMERSITRRLERVVERIIESEMRRFKAKFKGEMLSEEEMALVETMGKEIAENFLEEPIKYLTRESSCHRDFDSRMNDLKSLTNILEETRSVQ